VAMPLLPLVSLAVATMLATVPAAVGVKLAAPMKVPAAALCGVRVTGEPLTIREADATATLSTALTVIVTGCPGSTLVLDNWIVTLGGCVSGLTTSGKIWSLTAPRALVKRMSIVCEPRSLVVGFHS